MKARLSLLGCFLTVACHAPASAPERPRGERDALLRYRLEAIFLRDEFTSETFGPVRWDEDVRGTYLVVEPSSTVAGASEIVRYQAGSGRHYVLVTAEMLVPPSGKESLAIDDFAYFERSMHRIWYAGPDAGNRVLVYTNSKKVWRQNTRGDYWVLEFLNKNESQAPADPPRTTLKKLGGDAPEASLMFAKFSPDGTRVGYVRANDLYVEDLESGAITRLTHDGSPTSINGTSDWVYEEEFGLRDGWRWSPDGNSIAFWHFDSSGVPLYTLVNSTDALYPTLTTLPYPKAGQTNSAVKVGVIAASGGEPRWIELPGDPREMYVPRMEWVPRTNELVLQQMDRRQQTNTVWLVEASTGAAREFLRETSPDAWLDVVDDWRWLADGSLFWISERGGWRQPWSVSRAGEWRCLTPFAFDLTAVVGLDEERGWLYVQGSPEDAARRYLYRIPLAGGSPERVTPAGLTGTHTYDLAPGGSFALHTHSTLDRPPRVELVSLPEHESLRTLEENRALNAKMAAFRPEPSEFFRLELDSGIELDGWMLKPADFDARKSYPLLMYVYNEPSAVQANDAWKGVRGLFHHALAEAGYVVACVDTQGTPGPRGRRWRKSTYQRYAEIGAAQQAAAVRALCTQRSYLDPERVAVWGWSGGGSMTLNLLFRHPGVYRLGMSVAPVPDVTLYDSIYQERYTGLPATDAEAYRVNSPIHFAEGLADPLLLVHGSGDDNVHFQGSERLIDRLVELGKPFDFMLYPNRSHAINEGPGTLHHVYALLARTLAEHLPAGE